MVKKVRFGWFLAVIPCSMIWGSVNESVRWEWQTGYRNDTFHWHLKNPANGGALSYTEHARDLQFWENALTFRLIHRDIALFARGSFGAFGQGSLKQKYSNLSFTSATPDFAWHPTSWTLDGWGYFGYSVNLTSDRTYRVILIPMIGYGVNDEQLHLGGAQTLTGVASAPDQFFSMTSQIPGNERMCWFGPLFGGLFIIQPGGRLQFEAGYAYHLLSLRFRSKFEKEVSLYSANHELFSQSGQIEKIKVKDGSNLAHTGWARVDYILSNVWLIGLESQVQYFSSRILNAVMKNDATSLKTAQKFKIRWTAVSGGFMLSRRF
jgi:hypothetical protein